MKALCRGTVRMRRRQFAREIEGSRIGVGVESGKNLVYERVLQRRVGLANGAFDGRLNQLFRRWKFLQQPIDGWILGAGRTESGRAGNEERDRTADGPL